MRALGWVACAIAFLQMSTAQGAGDARRPLVLGDPDVRAMGLLTERQLHDLSHERWNVYTQATYISTWKLPFSAKYTNLNGSPHSLITTHEQSFTGTATLFLGVALWPGAEIYWVPELIAERPLSNLAGLGGVIQNFELQKTGSLTPTPYSSRLFIRQTFNLDGDVVQKSSAPMQLGGVASRRRFVLTVGNFSMLDFLDKNTVVGDPRRQLFNMAFLTHAAYDFAADARGYGWGAVLEFYFDAWAVRAGRITPPKHPNQLPLDFNFWQYYGDQIELEHTHRLFDQDGAVRAVAFRNRENMGNFDDAVAVTQKDPAANATTCQGFNYGSDNATAPDLCWARKPNIKWGVGLSFEQRLAADIGFFARGMFADGHTEVYSYTATDRSFSAGAIVNGTRWRRPWDVLGIAYAQGWISASHANYLRKGGIDGFIGDGNLTQASERAIELLYAAQVVGPVWLSVDYQFVMNPAYNADRGPVHIVGLRLHGEG